MAIAHDAATPSNRRRLDWLGDNPLVREIGRVPLPLGGKLLFGFAVVAALLALVAALGLLALNQSNSRGEQLRSLRQTAAYARQMEAEANALSTLVAQRSGNTFSPGAALRPDVYSGTDSDVLAVLARFETDVGLPAIDGGLSGFVRSVDPDFVPRLTKTLAAFATAWGTVTTVDAKGTNRPFGPLAQAGQLAAQAISEANSLDSETTNRANALVAANHNGFVHSRNLLIGVGAGSLALALALGLLLSSSVVAPLRRTQQQLATIAGGDFAGHVDVTNRDEIGALAADVNRMNDELGRLYKELETASRHKSDFLATMSHELRTPLNAIIGFSEVLHEQMFGELNERQAAYVKDVLEAGRHLLELINDVLDLAKIEAGRMELTLSEVAIPDLLRSAVSMHSERADRAGIALGLTTDPTEITITADERRVRQIVFNLLSNAVKFTPADGRVDVSARLDDGQVEIAVADTGPGIAAEDLETIFEEFEQTVAGKKAEGTGLGLPLSRKLVELHGGRLWAESEPGHGSTFRFTLPATEDPSLMDVAHETVQTPSRHRPRWSADNPVVRAIGRVRLPLGAKLIGGFTLVAALLAVAVLLGLLALGDSNSRGKKLLTLQKETAYEQLLLTDADNLAKLLGNRTTFGTNAGSSPAAVLRLVDSNISSAFTTLRTDFSQPVAFRAGAASLRRTAPALARIVRSTLTAFQSKLAQIELRDSQRRSLSTADFTVTESLMASLRNVLSTLAKGTSSRARDLVTQNDRGFADSRSLLIEVGAGSLGLALVLGLLLSWSVVAPLRRTEERLAEIGAGDFARRLEVVNRDEIGTLARGVNRMSDELQRVYRELELASEHKSQFLATMSHELRTPLNAIIGFSEVLHEQMFGELNERQLAYVNDVLEAGKHLLSLINDVLDLAKIEAGRMELGLSQVALPDVLRSAVSMHAERASRAGVELALVTEPEEIAVTADERRLRQVVFNLVSNAVKFTPANGRVDISARFDDGQVEVAVADTGPGIPAEDLERIFEEFEQTSGGKEAEGTGLGLPLSRKLVELHGGRLWAESEIGHGSTFRFTLPAHQEVS